MKEYDLFRSNMGISGVAASDIRSHCAGRAKQVRRAQPAGGSAVSWDGLPERQASDEGSQRRDADACDPY
jgi:hypothetical protein